MKAAGTRQPDQGVSSGAVMMAPMTNRERDPAQADSVVNPQKLRTGLNRIWHAAGYSLAGLRAGWGETAFRQEALASFVLLPLAFWVGRGWVEVALLAGSVLLVMIVELLNTGIETAIDRIGPEWNHLSKRAKDMGSGAVLLSLLLAAGTWTGAILARL
jgi:diacylglycerol kinase (ATP)